MATKNKLLASAHTLSSITDCVTKFYGGQAMKLIQVENYKWNVVRVSDEHVIPGCWVALRKARFRFERAAA